MQRLIENNLISWKDQVNRMPLLIRGARQVGKSYAVESFAKEYFSPISINFEKYPLYKQVFTTLEPQEIIKKISSLSGQPVIPGKTLLFLDEIQECPNAIQALRYFKEDLPSLHVIAAGSLLEFILNDSKFRMPVGRIQNYFLKPLSFKEFLLAMNQSFLLDDLAQVTPQVTVDTAIHEKLLHYLRQYLVTGGMPAVIAQYIATQNLSACQEVQANILLTYRNDFGKYANKTQHKYLQALFEQAPGLVGQHFKYVDVDPQMQSRDLKQALYALQNAGLVTLVYLSQATGLPLRSLINQKKFKLFFLDVGLTQYASLLSATLLMSSDLLAVNRGQIAEQFVGQELLTLGEIYQAGELYYWERDRGNLAEIDFVLNIDAHIIPIEVKAGATGRLRSLQIFMEERHLPVGVRISQHPLHWDGKILSVPLYMIHELPRLLESLF